jgi:hypothetical protein
MTTKMAASRLKKRTDMNLLIKKNLKTKGKKPTERPKIRQQIP